MRKKIYKIEPIGKCDTPTTVYYNAGGWVDMHQGRDFIALNPNELINIAGAVIGAIVAGNDTQYYEAIARHVVDLLLQMAVDAGGLPDSLTIGDMTIAAQAEEGA